MEDYEGALEYYQKALRGKEKLLDKTHPDTLATIMNMATAHMQRLKDFTKAEKMLRRALDGSEKSLGKDYKDTEGCARNLAILLTWDLKPKEKTRALTKEYPILLEDCGEFERGDQDCLEGIH